MHATKTATAPVAGATEPQIDSERLGTQREPAHEEIAELAYRLWQERGCPIGSPELDWLQAEMRLREIENS